MYKYDILDDLVVLFNLEVEGYIYICIGNFILVVFE